MTSLVDCVKLARDVKDAGFLGQMLAARALPTVRGRAQVRANVVAALQGRSTSLRGEIPALWRNWRVNAGAAMNPKNPRIGEDVAPEQVAEFYPPTLTRLPLNVRYWRKFLDLAASRQIPVYWVLFDVCHLDHQGAKTLSLDIADAIASGNGRRWVDLPAYRDLSAGGLVEDVEQSRLALDAAGKARR